MKNAKPVKTSKKILVLNTKNFKLAMKKEVILVDFWAPWCGPCKIIAPVLNDIAESQDNFTIGKVNVDENQLLAKKNKVRSIPTLIIYKNGVEAKRIVGVKSKKAILREVNAVIGS
ncbi:MAG: thioredoxin [Draconibacterium sp.]|nr:MAG: thioredoxin [Draconibacterium sp.]